MPWGRLDDSLYDHPKVDALPAKLRNACVGLWVRAISWSNRYLTDGALPTERLRKLDGPAAHVDALVAVGMFDRTPDGVVVHDFLTFNDSAADVRQVRKQKREAGRLGGLRSGETRRQAGAAADEQATTKQPLDSRLNSRPSPVPSLPNPVPSAGARVSETRREESAEEAQARFDRGWKRTRREQAEIRGESS